MVSFLGVLKVLRKVKKVGHFEGKSNGNIFSFSMGWKRCQQSQGSCRELLYCTNEGGSPTVLSVCNRELLHCTNEGGSPTVLSVCSRELPLMGGAHPQC